MKRLVCLIVGCRIEMLDGYHGVCSRCGMNYRPIPREGST